MLPVPGIAGVKLMLPVPGIAGVTLFNVTCPAWREWEPATPDATLKYEYRVKSLGASRSMLFYFGDNSRSAPTVFPVGNVMEGMQLEVELYVVDRIGDYKKSIYNVTVGFLFAQAAKRIRNKLKQTCLAVITTCFSLSCVYIVFAITYNLNAVNDI